MSLRTRVIAAVLLIAALLVTVLVFMTRTVENNLIAQIDDELLKATGPVRLYGEERSPGQDPVPPDGEGGFPQPPVDAEEDPRRPLSTLWIGVVAGGELQTVIEPGEAQDIDGRPDLSVADAEANAGEGPLTVQSTTSDSRWRAVVGTTGGDTVTVIALPLDSVDDSISQLVRMEVVAAFGIFAFLALVAFWVIRLGVRPLNRMTHVATAIAAGDLSQRVPEATPGTEAAELGEALNSMLGSIEETFEERREVEQRLRRFVGDASHELRTPIATIRGYAELYRSGALEDDGSLDDAMERTEAEAVRMGGLVDDLLALARMDQRQPLDLGEVDLAELAADAVEDCRAMDPERSVTLDAEVPVPVRAEEARIRQVLANLVANAVVHTPSSAAIVIRVRPGDDGGGHLEVCDDGPGMDSEVASRAFERFFRAEKSRSREHGGSGLGLSIVDSIVRAHGGTATLRSAPGRGTCVMVDLPRTADPASPAN